MSISGAILALQAEFIASGCEQPTIQIALGPKELALVECDLRGLITPAPNGAFQALGCTFWKQFVERTAA